ncbi:MAG TPA: gamma-glutamyl-gamma-aminobutyrate hydrolase family protein [Nitrososphaerales archaeon]|nr:gamma-glutamyl-gamma-aminobutyrate hydrolase family protein [Nitrososphaerales archaeon]
MVRVLAVNNYPTPERFERLRQCVEANGAAVTSVEWDSLSRGMFDSFDGVVLSGSPDMMSEERTRAKFARESEAILDSRVPILGVCFGHQMMARAFGADVVKDGKHVLEMVETNVLEDDPLFEGLPKSLMLLESRHEIVKSLPGGFRLLAKSATSEIASMKHEKRPLYGVQFHPERYTKENPEGNTVVGNFVRILK